MTLRVLAICQEDPEHILGGMGRHVGELYATMARRSDVEVDLLTCGVGDEPTTWRGFTKWPGDKLVAWKPRSPDMSSLLMSDIQMLRQLTQMLADGRRWDVVHVHEWNALQVARAARDALRVPLVGTMHLCITYLMEDGGGISGEMKDQEMYLMQMEGHLAVDTDEFIICSDAYRRLTSRLFMTDRDTNVIYNGIDTQRWSPELGDAKSALRRHGLPWDRPICLFVGRIAEMKGIRTIMDAVEREDNGWFYALAGEINANTKAARDSWDVTQRLERMNEELPDRFKWVGFQQGQALKDLYAAATVGLMPSHHEPFGLVALEHMAMGVPLISTEVDGLGEVVMDEAGVEYAMIVPPRSVEDILEALEILSDPKPREELRRLGLQRASQFDWHEIAAQTVDVYRRAVLNHSRPQEAACSSY